MDDECRPLFASIMLSQFDSSVQSLPDLTKGSTKILFQDYLNVLTFSRSLPGHASSTRLEITCLNA